MYDLTEIRLARALGRAIEEEIKKQILVSGKVEIESQVDAGTTVRVRLPLLPFFDIPVAAENTGGPRGAGSRARERGVRLRARGGGAGCGIVELELQVSANRSSDLQSM